MIRTACQLLLLSTVLCVLSGCGDGRPALVKASGTVKLNGEPLEGAIVGFQPLEVKPGGFGRPSSAVTDASGKFTLSTFGNEDGIPVGKYKVAIEKKDVVGKLPDNYNSEYPENTPLRYQWTTPKELSDPETSGLTVEVTSSGLVPEVIELSREGNPQIEDQIQQRANEP